MLRFVDKGFRDTTRLTTENIIYSPGVLLDISLMSDERDAVYTSEEFLKRFRR